MAVEDAGAGVTPPAKPGGRGGGGAEADGTAALNPVSVRSRVDEPRADEPNVQRLRTAGRAAGREMARRLLDGLGQRDHRLRRCGWRLGDARTFKRDAAGRVRNVGVERCANGRLCPVCGPALASVRAAQVGAAVYRWLDGDEARSAVFLSLAPSHKRADRLVELHGQLMAARAAVMNPRHRQWKAFKARFGIVDLAWKVEHNLGANGPHVGLHAVLLTTRWWEADEAQAAEAWLIVRFREELARAGFTGRLSATYGLDVRPVDDPVAAATYLAKWGIGQELAAEADKLGRNGENVPYAAIPSILALEIGRRDPHVVARRDQRVRMLVEGWAEFVQLAGDDGGHWWRGFRTLKDLVPELRSAHRPADVIAKATEILPPELRPEESGDAEAEEDDGTPGQFLEVDGDAWSAAVYAWFRWEAVSLGQAVKLRRWVGCSDVPLIPLELAVAWMGEDDGLRAAAEYVADLAGAVVIEDDDGRLAVRFEHETSSRD